MVRAVLILAVSSLLLAFPAYAADEAAVQKPAQGASSKAIVPETQGRAQPQGATGPINTQPSGGAPAESPQGETPPGMQSAPEGSSKTTKESPE
jgi:hypothetical protein